MTFRADTAATIALYTRKNVLAVLLMGFASGLPLALTTGTIAAWLTTSGIDIKTIGLFALTGLPYTVKYLWSPAVDRFGFPVLTKMLGQRRSWILVCEIILCGLMVTLATLDPKENILYVAYVAIAIAFVSATHDIVIDALRIERLEPEELGPGSAAVTSGYRLGMIASGGLALVIAGNFGWEATYFYVSILIFTGFIASMILGEPLKIERAAKSFADEFRERVINPFGEFVSRKGWILILLFILFYKLCDAFLLNLQSPFLIKLGFELQTIGYVAKTFGVAATIVGAIIGGWMVARLGMIRSLAICGVLQILSNFVFIYQYHVGADISVLYLTTSVESVTSGMAIGALVSYISALCRIDFTATQYALLSSFTAIGRAFLSSYAGFVAQDYGWVTFFVVSALLGLPALFLLYFLKEPTALEDSRNNAGAATAVRLSTKQKIIALALLGCMLAYAIYYIQMMVTKSL